MHEHAQARVHAIVLLRRTHKAARDNVLVGLLEHGQHLGRARALHAVERQAARHERSHARRRVLGQRGHVEVAALAQRERAV